MHRNKKAQYPTTHIITDIHLIIPTYKIYHILFIHQPNHIFKFSFLLTHHQILFLRNYLATALHSMKPSFSFHIHFTNTRVKQSPYLKINTQGVNLFVHKSQVPISFLYFSLNSNWIIQQLQSTSQSINTLWWRYMFCFVWYFISQQHCCSQFTYCFSHCQWKI